MHMYDSWGDGWNGAWYYIYDSSEQVASGTLWSGSYGSDTFTVPSQANLSIQVTAGSYAFRDLLGVGSRRASDRA